MDKYIQQSTAIFGSLKNAVLGNPVLREFTIGEQIASFGPGLLWKVFEGKKNSTGHDVAVFVFEKALVDRYEKKQRELIFERMRHGPQQLTKLRHPRILTVQHPLEEARDSLAFATEPIFGSLSNVLGKHENFSNGMPQHLKDFELYAVEKVYGLLQLVDGLSFLHKDANINEGNLTTDNIVLTKGGHWKLAGFHFSSSKMNPNKFTEYTTSISPYARQDLNYLAPEWIFAQSNDYSFDICKADMFSFGCLINAVYNHLKTPFDASDNLAAYKKSTEQLSRLGTDYLKNVPLEIRGHVQLLLNVSADRRPDAFTTLSHPFFDDIAAMTLKYLDTLVQRDDLTKSQFFKNLPQVLDKLPLRVLHQRILPPLFSEFPNHMMVPFVLPNVLTIAEQSTNESYMKIIFPELKKVFNINKPIEVLLILMQSMKLLLKKTSGEEVKTYVLPLIFRALESPAHQIQGLVVGVIPDIAELIDYSSLKNAIIPRMKLLLTKTPSLTVRVNTLVCMGKIIQHLDKFILVDQIFPVFLQIPSNDPAVLMGVLGIYKQAMLCKKIQLEKDYLAKRAIPFLLPLSMEPTLNANQFNNFMSVIREMFDRVEHEHRTKLEQLEKMQEQQKTSLDFAKKLNEKTNEKQIEVINKVDELIIGKSVTTTITKSMESNSEISDLFGSPVNIKSESNYSQKSLMELSNNPSSTKTCNSSTSSVVMKPNSLLNNNNSSSLSSQMMMKNLSDMKMPHNTEQHTQYQQKSAVLSQQQQKSIMLLESQQKSSTLQHHQNSSLMSQQQTTSRVIQGKQSSEFQNKMNTSFNSILSAEMKNFQSNQEHLSMATMQRMQQQQHSFSGLTPQIMNQNHSQGTSGMSTTPLIPNQSQSITMFQTQMFMTSNNVQLQGNNSLLNPYSNSNMNANLDSAQLPNSNNASNALISLNSTSMPLKSSELSSQDINDLLN